MSDKISVKSGLGKRPDGGFPIAIYEVNDEHEDGELFIGDDKVHSVVLTSAVQVALKKGDLVKAGAGEKAGEKFNPPLSPDKPLEVLDSDDAASLEKRYSKEELVSLADKLGVDIDPAATKPVIAEAILGADPDDQGDDPDLT